VWGTTARCCGAASPIGTAEVAVGRKRARRDRHFSGRRRSGADVDGRLGPPAAAAMNSCLQRTQQSVLGAPPRRSVTRAAYHSRPSDLASSVFQLWWRRIGQPRLKHDGADRTEPDPGNWRAPRCKGEPNFGPFSPITVRMGDAGIMRASLGCQSRTGACRVPDCALWPARRDPSSSLPQR